MADSCLGSFPQLPCEKGAVEQEELVVVGARMDCLRTGAKTSIFQAH